MVHQPAQDNDDDAVWEEGDEDEYWHEVSVDNLNNIKGTQPGGGIDYVTTSSLLAPDGISFLFFGRKDHHNFHWFRLCAKNFFFKKSTFWNWIKCDRILSEQDQELTQPSWHSITYENNFKN